MKEDILGKIWIKTPIGLIKVLHSNKGVREITLDQEYTNNEAIVNLEMECVYKGITVMKCEGPLFQTADETVRWLSLFFSKDRESSELECLPPIDNLLVDKDNFTGKVLRTLAEKVISGTTVSYAKLAELCGSPKAYRAVGKAMRANPLPLVIPCHRVVTSNGRSGHYMGGKGDNIKKWLLHFESYCQDKWQL